MIQGIAIFGLNGGGKSTLTHALANPSAIIEKIKMHPKFIISGVTMNWSDEILSRIGIAFWVQTPLEERLNRIKLREEKRFGARVQEGGDMYKGQMDFRKWVESRDLSSLEESALKLLCPVIVIDGTLPVSQNLEKMIEILVK